MPIVPLRMGSQEATNEVPNHMIVTLFGDFKGYPWKLDAGREPRSVGSAVTYSSGVEGYGSRPKTPERFLVKDLFSHFSHGLKPTSRKFRARAAQGTRKYYCYHYYKYYF